MADTKSDSSEQDGQGHGMAGEEGADGASKVRTLLCSIRLVLSLHAGHCIILHFQHLAHLHPSSAAAASLQYAPPSLRHCPAPSPPLPAPPLPPPPFLHPVVQRRVTTPLEGTPEPTDMGAGGSKPAGSDQAMNGLDNEGGVSCVQVVLLCAWGVHGTVCTGVGQSSLPFRIQAQLLLSCCTHIPDRPR